MAAALIAAVLAGCGGNDPAAGPTPAGGESDGCRIGGKSSQPPSRGIEALVLGCWRLPDGRRLEVTGYRDPQLQGGRLCVGYWLPLQGHGAGCADGRLAAGRAIGPLGYGRVDDATTMLFGSASLRVGAVVMRLDSGERRSAGLARITQPELLRRLRVSRPFAVYFGEVRTKELRHPRDVVVEARDQRGELLDEEVTDAPVVITG